MTGHTPKIAVPEFAGNSVLDHYLHAACAAGMEPVIVSGKMSSSCFDGLLLPGGGDVNPAVYGQQNQESREISDALDDLQMTVLCDFVRAKKPVLGICRGLQIINVCFGGSLYQNLETSFRHAKKPGEPDKVHDSFAVKDSWIEKLYGDHFFHNSSHHQGVKQLGEGLVADSRSAGDNVVEALHHSLLPVFAVQWHPERMCLSLEREDTVNGLEVFSFFCRVCRETQTLKQDPSETVTNPENEYPERWCY